MRRAKKSGLFAKKKTQSRRTENKTRKYVKILVISLIVMIMAFVAVICVPALFENMLNSESDMWDVHEDAIAPVDKVSGKINVLILGVDKEGLRTDTIIVASYDANNGKVDMLSIPRDTRMYIGSRYQKINAAHAISQKNGKIWGPAGTIDAVTRLTGIPINYYVEFSFEAFRETIDALGGVKFNVPQRMKYQDPVQGLYIDLYKGEQVLDGDKAEQLVRFRRYPEGDIKRVRVQQEFIQAVIEQKLNLQIITKIPDIYKVVSKNIKTNLTLNDIIRYAKSLVDIDRNKIVMYELPGQYSGSEYAASYWLPDMKEVKLLVQNTFGYETDNITSGKPLSGADYGKHTTEKIKPEDVKVLEQDRHKPPVYDDNSSSDDDEDSFDEDETKKSQKEDEESEESEEKQDNKKRPDKNVEENTKETDDTEETDMTDEIEEPVEETTKGSETSDGFVRPGAH